LMKILIADSMWGMPAAIGREICCLNIWHIDALSLKSAELIKLARWFIRIGKLLAHIEGGTQIEGFWEWGVEGKYLHLRGMK
jgi:hypothetical protein